MKEIEVKCKMYEALDGQRFHTEAECRKYELSNDIHGMRSRRIAVIIHTLNQLKGRGKECKPWDSLPRRQKEMNEAKRAFLQAAKGKRRHTYQFAKELIKTGEKYVIARDYFFSGVARFAELVKELKEIAPQYDRNPQYDCKRKGGAV